MRFPRTLLAVLATALTSLTLSHCQSGAHRAGAETPEELMRRLGAAEAAGRFGDMVELIPAQQRNMVVWATWFGAAYESIGKDQAVVDAYQEILDEHGLDEKWLNTTPSPGQGLEDIAAKALEGRSLAQVFDRFTLFVQRLRPDDTGFGLDQPLEGIQVDGDRAEAKVGLSEFSLVKIDDRWYWQFLPESEFEEG